MEHDLTSMTAFLRQRTDFRRGVALVLGSGLGEFADGLDDKTVVPYADIPGYPCPTVEGHAGELVFGRRDGIPILAAKGRFHLYEGHDLATVTLPVRLFRRLGARFLVLTNAAGSTRRQHPPGTLLLLTGHLDGTFRDGFDDPVPVTGPPVHDPRWLDLARAAARRCGVPLAEGAYCWTLGPAYETPAEIEYFQGLGADAVGMSTVPELRAAATAGLPALGISCLTNYAAGITDRPLTHAEVMETAEAVKDKFARLLLALIAVAGAELRRSETETAGDD